MESGINFVESIYNNNNNSFSLRLTWQRRRSADSRAIIMCAVKERKWRITDGLLPMCIYEINARIPLQTFPSLSSFRPPMFCEQKLSLGHSRNFFLLLNSIGHYYRTLRNYRTKRKHYSLQGSHFCTQYIYIYMSTTKKTTVIYGVSTYT